METNKSGFLIINKPSGPTSHDIINRLRKITGIKKIGHAGTLDPFASGVLVVGVGRDATKKISGFVKLNKEYEAALLLGAITDTYDREGKLTEKSGLNINDYNTDQIKKILKKFTGKQKQIPPMYSAKKIKGKKLYELARAGITVERKPTDIEIYDIKITKYNFPSLVIKVKCSTGTYIRSLAHDIGQTLGCGAYLQELERTAVGNFKISQAVAINKLDKNNWHTFLIKNEIS